jgi:hypothetical protein
MRVGEGAADESHQPDVAGVAFDLLADAADDLLRLHHRARVLLRAGAVEAGVVGNRDEGHNGEVAGELLLEQPRDLVQQRFRGVLKQHAQRLGLPPRLLHGRRHVVARPAWALGASFPLIMLIDVEHAAVIPAGGLGLDNDHAVAMHDEVIDLRVVALPGTARGGEAQAVVKLDIKVGVGERSAEVVRKLPLRGVAAGLVRVAPWRWIKGQNNHGAGRITQAGGRGNKG